MKQTASKEKYERWTRLSSYVSMALGIGIIPLGIGFFHGIHVIEERPHVYNGSRDLGHGIEKMRESVMMLFQENQMPNAPNADI